MLVHGAAWLAVCVGGRAHELTRVRRCQPSRCLWQSPSQSCHLRQKAAGSHWYTVWGEGGMPMTGTAVRDSRRPGCCSCCTDIAAADWFLGEHTQAAAVPVKMITSPSRSRLSRLSARAGVTAAAASRLAASRSCRCRLVACHILSPPPAGPGLPAAVKLALRSSDPSWFRGKLLFRQSWRVLSSLLGSCFAPFAFSRVHAAH